MSELAASHPDFLPTDVALPYGLGSDGNLVSVAVVERGLACECICPGCRKPLVAKKGQIIRHHFAHASDESCSSGFESMLHLLAKDIIARERSITVPEVVVECGLTRRLVRESAVLPLANVRLEQWLDGIRPDIIADVYGHTLIIEIAVTHKAEPPKIMELERRGAPAIEIDLSEFHKREVTESALRSALFSAAPRYWLFNRLESAALPEVLAEERARIAAEEAREIQREEERARLAREWARVEIEYIRQEEQRAQQQARKRARDMAMLEEVKTRVIAQAQMVVGEDAESWVEERFATFRAMTGEPSGESYGRDFESWCYQSLDKRYNDLLAIQKSHQDIRDSVLRVAIAKFKDREKADLWMNTSNPRVGGKPMEVCVTQNGIEICKAALR